MVGRAAAVMLRPFSRSRVSSRPNRIKHYVGPDAATTNRERNRQSNLGRPRGTGAGQARRRRRGSGAAAATAKSIPILLSSSFVHTKTRYHRRRAILGQHTYQCVAPADAACRRLRRRRRRRRPAISH